MHKVRQSTLILPINTTFAIITTVNEMLSFQYHEKRLEDERDLMEKRQASLTDELHSTQEQLLSVRRDNVVKTSKLQREVDDKNELVRQLVRFPHFLSSARNYLICRSWTFV